ncbi:MAG: hypothetical protein ABW156_09215 [Jiangellaceae bacterium]
MIDDYLRVELEPAPNAFFDGGSEPPPGHDLQSGPDQPTAARELMYAQRAAAYEAGLEPEYARIRWGRRRGQSHPEHRVRLPGRTVRVVYDATLKVQLLRIYLVHGWPGIQAVQDALVAATRAPASKPLHPWAYATSFFGFTRNLLVLSIRDALITIERKAADRLVAELTFSGQLLADCRAQVDLRESTTNAQGKTEMLFESSPSWDSPVRRQRVFYTFGRTAVAERLYILVHRAVTARTDLAGLVDRRDRLRADIDGIGVSGGAPTGMELDLKEAETQAAHIEANIDALYEDIHRICPLALLAVPLLTLPFDSAAMQQTVGECLAQFQGESERISAAYQDRAERVADWIPGERPGVSPELLYAAGIAPEADVVTRVLAGAPQDPGLLALAGEGVLRLLVERGDIAFDSFEYVVLMHYLTELQRALITETERLELLDRVVNKVAALISLALWIVPAGRIVRLVTAAFTVSVLSYQTYSVLHRLSIMDRTVADRLAGLDRHRAAEIVALSELAMQRESYLKSIGDVLLTELALIVAAGAVAEFRLLMHVRGVYLDLETLIGT